MLLENVRKVKYDKTYFTNPLYVTKPFSKREYKRIELIKMYKQSGSLLEIGSAEGYLLKLLSKDFSVHGIEISKYAVEKSKKILNPENITLGNIENVPLKDSNYDIVVAFNILEHIQDPEDTLLKIFRALKRGGLLIGSVPNNQKLLGEFFTDVSNFLDKTHISTLQIVEWRKLFKDSGFLCVDEMGETVLGRGKSVYNKNNVWPFYSQNYVFIYKKPLT
jgi:2-polyprenyl-3-methyl-5-hydroxy-6-metoxy-1,4-benzoquinol methylase